MSFLFRKSQEQNKYPAINPFEEENIRDTYLNAQPDEQPSLRSEKNSRTIRLGEVQAIFGNKHLQEDREERIQDMGFLKKREHLRLSSDEESWSDRQSPLNFIIISGVLLLSVLVGWCIYYWMSLSYDQQPPVITAENSPFKQKPENPGGLVIPHQDKLVYGRIMPEQQQAVEHLLPQPEQPVDLPGQLDSQEAYLNDPYARPQEQYPAYAAENSYGTQADAQGYPYDDTRYGQDQQPDSPYERNLNNPHTQSYGQASVPHRERARQQNDQRLISPDISNPIDTIQQPRQHSRPRAPQPQPYTAPAYPNATYKNTPPQQTPFGQQQDEDIPAYEGASQERARQRMGRSAIDASETASKGGIYHSFAPPSYNDGIPEAKTLETTAAEREKTPLDALIDEEISGKPSLKGSEDLTETKTNKGAYRLQVATFPSESEAENEVKRLRHLDTSLMKNVKFIVQKFKKGKSNKIMYRVMIGFFADAKTANQFKNKLKIHRVSGIIVKN